MRVREAVKTLLIAAACVLAVALPPAGSEAQQKAKSAKMAVPPGGCAISGGVLESTQTCAAKCNEFQWCPVQWCVQGKLEPTVFSCWEPSGLCVPKC
jgi:hypothetical protein